MKSVHRITAIALSLVLLTLGSVEEKRLEAVVSTGSLELSVEILSTAPVGGKVVLVNRGSSEIRVWRAGNSWGDETLSFVAIIAGRKQNIIRKPQTYTRNVPASVTLPREGKYEIPFELGDDSWEPPIKESDVSDTQLEAMYRIVKSPESETHHVWTGEIHSEPVRLK